MIRESVLALLSAALPSLSSPALAAPPERDQRIERIVRAVSAEQIRANIEKLASFGTRHTLSDTTDPSRGIGAARRWIKATLDHYASAAGGRMKVSYDAFTVQPSERIPHPTRIVNVVATLSPKDPSAPGADRIVVIGGHYDSRATQVLDATSNAPGADDDGSGTALVLELARVLSREDLRSTIVFICYAGEEQGLFGSTHWAEQAHRDGLNVEAVLNNDIVGAIHGGGGETESTYVRVFSQAFSPLDTGAVFRMRNGLGWENDGGSRSLARYAEEVSRRYLPHFHARMIYRLDRFLRGGDQYPFHELGIPAIRFTEATESFDHQHQDVRMLSRREYGDLAKFINPAYCANVARVNAAVAASLALSPLPPDGATLVVSGLAYDTQLRWRRINDREAGGYLVRWRSTTSPVWEHTEFTADTAITLHASKDDNLFAVQSVSKSGDASLYVLPLPGR